MVRCEAITKTGTQCKLNTQKRFPYCWIHLLQKDKLVVKKSTIPNAGNGLFYVGKDTVKKDKNITKYSGVVTDTPDKSSAYVVGIAKNKFLDAKHPLTAVGRYINGTKGNMRPNVALSGSRTFTPYYGQPSINIRTLKQIKPNTELFLNYGREYWK